MPPFRFAGSFEPKGDQPAAIDGICEGMEAGEPFVTLLGATKSTCPIGESHWVSA